MYTLYRGPPNRCRFEAAIQLFKSPGIGAGAHVTGGRVLEIQLQDIH